MEKEVVEREVRKEIKKYLDKCDSAHYPKLCEIIKTKEGYRKAEGFIIFLLIYGSPTIGTAISQVESELL